MSSNILSDIPKLGLSKGQFKAAPDIADMDLRLHVEPFNRELKRWGRKLKLDMEKVM